MFQCILEIAVGPVFARVADYFDSGIAERTDDGKSGVGRTVVGNRSEERRVGKECRL